MTLGERLRSYLPEGVEQKVIAMNWIARLEAAGLKALSPSTAPSRLSELLADDAQGVRAFFRDPRRANALFDVLSVPEAERDELRLLAEPTLAGAPQPRLVVDLSDLGNDRTAMDAAFGGVRETVFGEGGVFPVALVLTETQYDLLPRSFDRFKDRMQVERVVDAAAGAEAAVRLAGEGTCVASRRPLVDLGRWWAIEIEKGTLLLEPRDGLGRIRATGSLGVPVVAHPLAVAPAKPGGATPSVQIPAGGVARRRLAMDLADEESSAAQKSRAWRAAAAEALGVQATSTEQERTEAEIDAIVATLGMEVTSGKAAEWEDCVARAARRPTEPCAMRVGDTIRVLNPPSTVVSHGRLEVTRVACAEPHLVTLERALAKCTEDDLLDDPLLGGLIQRLARKDEQALKLLFHARAVLVYGGRVRPAQAKPVKDPLGVLRTLLANDVPSAQVRVRVEAAPVRFGPKECSVALTPFVFPDGRMYYEATKGSLLLWGVPPVGDVLFSRGTNLRVVVPGTEYQRHGTSDYKTFPPPPALVDPTADASQWLDDVEASALFGASNRAKGWSPNRHLPEPSKDHAWQTLPEPADLWLQADTHLALAWLALREALPAPRWIRLPDGSILLQVGGGLAARISVRRFGKAKSPIRGAVRCTVSARYNGGRGVWDWNWGDLATPITTHVADTYHYHTRVSVLLPSVWITGCGHAMDVSFLPAPMLPGRAEPEVVQAAAAAGAVAAADTAARNEEEQRMWDDDD